MNAEKRHVVVAPLNWGLGHATRSMPIIRELLKQGHRVTVASDGLALKLMQSEFPSLDFWELPGYGVHYQKPVLLSLTRQIPDIQRIIRQEHLKILDRLKASHANVIISDNRYGVWHPDIPSILITHQIQLPIGRRMTKFMNPWLGRYLNPFREIWVPDFAPPDHLTGYMTETRDSRVVRIGPLTRFAQCDLEENIDLLVLISGPEPARTRWETHILQEAARLPYQQMVLLRGLPGEASRLRHSNERLTIHNHLPAHALNTLIGKSRAIICRAGYSTIMDLMVMGKSAIMVPTPGQPEQEYLARRLDNKHLAVVRYTELFDIQQAVLALKHCNPWPRGSYVSWHERFNSLTQEK